MTRTRKNCKFSSNYKITIGADFSVKSLQWSEDTKINLQLWDVAGHERFGFMTRVYYKHAVAAAIVFDMSRTATFESVSKWLADMREKVALQDDGDLPIVLLANKCDIQGATISSERISKFCEEMSISKWFQTSAKHDINIDEAVMHLVRLVMHTDQQMTAPDGLELQLACQPAAKDIRSCCV